LLVIKKTSKGFHILLVFSVLV